MNPSTLQEARKLFDTVKRLAARQKRITTIIAPPLAFLADLSLSYSGTNISFAAQDVFFEMKGAHTGEVSAPMLGSIGAEYVIIGHSERRARGERNEDIHKKMRIALAEGLKVIFCVGEQERDQNASYLAFITEELISALSGVSKESLKRIIIVYEPIWAIGKRAEDAMSPHDMHEMSLFIRKVLATRYDRESALSARVLYGGSVEPTNALKLLSEGDIQGFLVGHASLSPQDFKEILSIAHSL